MLYKLVGNIIAQYLKRNNKSQVNLLIADVRYESWGLLLGAFRCQGNPISDGVGDGDVDPMWCCHMPS